MLAIFWLGTFVGFKKAMFVSGWQREYDNQFGGPRSMLSFGMMGDDNPNSHGAFGQVIAVNLPQIVVKGEAEAEKTILIGTSTMIRRYHDIASSSDISVGSNIIVIGNPDDKGEVLASFIRIMDMMDPRSSTSTYEGSGLHRGMMNGFIR